MGFIELLIIVFISVFLGSVFFYGFRRRGPWGSFWSFLIILFLGILLFDVWTEPIGPLWYGVGWLDLLIIGLLFSLLLAASSPTLPSKTEAESEEFAASAIAIGVFFWLFVLLILISIAVGIWIN